TVGMNDDKPAPSDKSDQPKKGQQVFKGVDFSHQSRLNGQGDAARPHLINQTAFGPGLRAGDDADCPMLFIEEGSGQHGIFLRAADNQAGDGVKDGDGG
ncbi:MAG: hypothetical protein D6732_09525, partial [Methanobacteriota archaeon]